jgi:hypothetical protein
VLFIMPTSREYQFPAMSALQAYVNCFQQKMTNNYYMSDNTPVFSLRYWCDIAEEDWEFFKTLGIELKQDRQPIGYPDAVIDLSLARLLSFDVVSGNKHCAQICAAIAGVEAPPFPKVRPRRPDPLMQRIVAVHAFIEGTELLSHDDFMELPDGVIGALVGYRGWETYMAAAQGLPVVELLPEGCNPAWLSKWSNPFYRAVEVDHNMQELVQSALTNLKGVLRWLYEKDRALAARGMSTDRSMSSAPLVASTSDPAL